MDIPENAMDLAMVFEGFRSKPYLCPAGHWTIGWGHLCAKDHPQITKEQGRIYLTKDLQVALRGTLRICPILLLEKETAWLGAIADFVFNLGAGRLQTSTLRRKINSEEWEDVPVELIKWIYGGGRKLRGLILRREAEARYFNV